MTANIPSFRRFDSVVGLLLPNQRLLEISPATMYFGPSKDVTRPASKWRPNLYELSPTLKKMLPTTPKNATKAKLTLLKQKSIQQMKPNCQNGEILNHTEAQ
jgi:hypothetical protein